MHLLDRAVLPTPVPPCLTPPRRKRHALNILKVVFSTNGDLIRVHSYGDHCSTTWDTALTYGRLESGRGDGTGVAIRPEERAWLDGIRTLASEWLAAVEANDRSWMARVVTRIQRCDDRSDGLIDLMVGWCGRRIGEGSLNDLISESGSQPSLADRWCPSGLCRSGRHSVTCWS
jgi:hypothetical protein